jgi:hypothetical protein
MNTRFLATTRHRLCPLCNDHTGDCRVTIDGNILCHTNAYHDGVIKNWQFLKTIEPAPWGFFVPVDQSVHQRCHSRRLITVEKNQQELEQKRFALSASEFDREFRRLKQPTGLDFHHRQDLLRRRFNQTEINQEALRQRDELIEKLALLPPIPSALDQIIQYFGQEKVAEVTGRSRRIIREVKANSDKLVLQNRSSRANMAETTAFMNDEKQILLFSQAGGTGRSYQ